MADKQQDIIDSDMGYISDAAVLNEALQNLHGAEIREIELVDDKALVAILPQGKRVVSLEDMLGEVVTKPRRRTGVTAAFDQGSFIDLVKRWGDQSSTVILADPDRSAPKLRAVFDHHPSGPSNLDAGHRDHTVRYQCRLADEWKVWQKIHGKWLSHAEFAEFVEDRIQDLAPQPLGDEKAKAFGELVHGTWGNPTDLIAHSRGLQINSSTLIRSAVTLATGEIALSYEVKHTDGSTSGGSVQVANLFLLSIPVFYGGQSYRIPMRLRYRAPEGKIVWSCHLYRAEEVFDDAFLDLVKLVRSQVEPLPVVLGS